jgi:hypothetical protein
MRSMKSASTHLSNIFTAKAVIHLASLYGHIQLLGPDYFFLKKNHT